MLLKVRIKAANIMIMKVGSIFLMKYA